MSNICALIAFMLATYTPSMYTATGASRLSWKFVCEIPRRLKTVNSGDQAENRSPGTCCTMSVVVLTPRSSS